MALVEKLHLRRFIRKVGHAYRYCLTHFGKEIIAAAVEIKELLLILQLAFSPAS